MARSLVGVAAIAVPAMAADPGQQERLGDVLGEVSMVPTICPALRIDEEVRAMALRSAGLDPAQPSAAFQSGFTTGEERAADAIANERTRIYCREMLEFFGPEGSRVRGLVRPK